MTAIFLRNAFQTAAVCLILGGVLCLNLHSASAAPEKVGSKAAQQPAVNPKSAELNEEGAKAVQSKDFQKAETLFRQALSHDSHNLTAVFNLAGMYVTNKKEQAAVNLLESYISKYPDDAGLQARLADVQFGLGKPSQAVKHYEKALELDPAYPRVHARLAVIYSMMNRLPDAEKMLIQAIKEQPGDAQLYANLSSIQLANNKFREAIGTAKKALQMQVSSEVYITLGTAYELNKEYDEALIAFQRAVDLGDKRPELAAKIKELQALKK